MTVKILHNPRCSKSRQTLALLEENGVAFEVELYLNKHYTEEQIKTLAKQLGVASLREMMRTKDELYRSLGLTDESVTEQQLLAAIIQHSALLERPVVIHGDKAKIGRPPESVLDIL